MTAATSGLSRSGFLVLLAIADQPRHGLGIVDEVEEGTDGRVRLGPGTLYGTIQTLSDRGLIRETPDVPDPDDDDPRRRYYRITAGGERLLREEVDRMSALVSMAARKQVTGGA
jgi:DNA-binding PadR family transcriptional regulator